MSDNCILFSTWEIIMATKCTSNNLGAVKMREHHILVYFKAYNMKPKFTFLIISREWKPGSKVKPLVYR